MSNSSLASSRRVKAQIAVRAGLLVVFAWMAGRFWHPYFGFTRFLLLDEQSAAVLPADLRGAPLFTYRDGYDGHYYAQLAARPAVTDPALEASVDSLPYRARRILLSWIAWVAGGGDPVAAVRAYAWLNLAVWAVLAVVLWRLVPPTGWRETMAWAGILFSAGVLHSVRLALTDLLALLLVVGALLFREHGRNLWATGLLGLGGLARETALLAVVSWLPKNWRDKQGWGVSLGWALLAALPLAAWLLYLVALFNWREPGMGNFATPFTGYIGKWGDALRELANEPDVVLAAGTLLAHLGLTAQAGWILLRRDPTDPWWRVGLICAGLMLLLGPAVWGGHPGAATRVLLPMTVAFNVLAARRPASWAWLIVGNLTVVAGITAFRDVPPVEREIASGRSLNCGYVAKVTDEWHQIEHHRSRTWAWTPRSGEIEVNCWPTVSVNATVVLTVRAVTPRGFTVLEHGVVRLTGMLGNKPGEYTVPNVRFENGVARLRLETNAEPVRESAERGGRELGLALYGVRLLDF